MNSVFKHNSSTFVNCNRDSKKNPELKAVFYILNDKLFICCDEIL